MTKRQGFVVGALVLSLSGFLVKLVGAIFRIPLTNLVGAAAMGYYSSAYSVYVFLLALQLPVFRPVSLQWFQKRWL
jgi:stage V sporulation protein B